MLGIRPGRPGKESATALQSPPATYLGAHSGPPSPQTAAVPRPPQIAGEVLGNVPTVATEAPGTLVQARCTALPRRRGRAAPGSGRRFKRCLVRGPGLLPDAYSGGIHRSRSGVRVYEAHDPHSRARRAHRLPPASVLN